MGSILCNWLYLSREKNCSLFIHSIFVGFSTRFASRRTASLLDSGWLSPERPLLIMIIKDINR